MLTGVVAGIGFPPLPGTISISCVSDFRILSELSVSGAACPAEREVTLPKASESLLRFLWLATDNLHPGLPILLQILRITPKPTLVARQRSYAGSKQWKAI